MAYNNMGLLLILYIGLMEFVEVGRFIGFGDWLRSCSKKNELPQLPNVQANSKTFRKWLAGQEEKYRDACGSARAVRQCLSHGLTDQEKSTLLMGFLFTKPSVLGTALELDYRHLRCVTQPAGNRGCTSYCAKPESSELDTHLAKLATHLYGMRSALVHRATGTAFVDPSKRQIGEESSSYFDVYFTASGEVVHYDVTLKQEELLPILKRCLLRRALRD